MYIHSSCIHNILIIITYQLAIFGLFNLMFKGSVAIVYCFHTAIIWIYMHTTCCSYTITFVIRILCNYIQYVQLKYLQSFFYKVWLSKSFEILLKAKASTLLHYISTAKYNLQIPSWFWATKFSCKVNSKQKSLRL